jgi:Ca2+-binding RTX toxin-like protein
VKIKFSGTSVTSDIAVKVPAPANYTGGPYWDPFSFGIRSVQTIDLNGDGYRDIFISPSYATFSSPGLHPYVLINDGKGHFSDGTSALFAAGFPYIQSPNNVFINHFTADGRLGMFVVDQGLELHNIDGSPDTVKGWSAPLQFWLQDEHGVFQNMSAGIDVNPVSFNHISSVADINGDGNLDVIVTRLGGPTVEGGGTAFYLGDGKGNFHFSTASLPQEIKYMPNGERDWNSVDYQFSGTNTAADLDGDGRADLVTASYTGNDQLSGAKTVRVFHQDASGQFTAAFQMAQPAAIQAMGPMGASAIAAGDLDGDGLRDLVIEWEGNAGTVIELLKNLGNDRFEDSTVAWLGSYLQRSAGRDATGEWVQSPSRLAMEDINHDGALDLVFYQYGVAGKQIEAGSPGASFVYLNDGAGHLSAAQPVTTAGPITARQFDAASGLDDYQLGMPLVFDTTNSGHDDFVFISREFHLDTSVAPANVTTLRVTTVFGDDNGSIYRAADAGSTLYGSGAPGTFYGGSGADSMHGGASGDTFNGLAGHDRIDGGAGIDTLVLGATRAGYAITAQANGEFALVESAHRGNTADLVNVERIRFADTAVALDIAGNAGQAYRIYQAAFNRTPDAGGLGFWIAAMDRGSSLVDVAAGFVKSAEFTGLYGANPGSADIVGHLYQNILHRAPDKGGFDFWVAKLDSHAISLADLLAGFSESPENQAALIGTIGAGIAYTPFG